MTSSSEQLIKSLKAIESVSQQFNATLNQEKTALEDSNTEEVLALSLTKKTLVSQLEKHTKTTHVFLKNIKINKGIYGLSYFIEQMKPSDIQQQLSKLWLSIHDLTETNKQLNDVNGSVIELNRRFIQRSLDVLHGQTSSNSSTTYGSDGQAMKKKLSRNLFTA